ncbi:uncharacterized protein BN659_01680 [Bacteroides sp. CAG:443]|jgi:hypothetical protein|uniref:DUF4251 domain-containing protein n=2 Tax=Phocaeicola sp. TaxID=2773926 RepID=UPI000335B209|nr:uncharacterized protein BN659_01680 [Bacteroides sp. CAG:443]
MKKYVLFMILALTMVVGRVQAQSTEQNLSREEKKALQEQLDSLLAVEAVQAINEKAFTLEADRVVFKYGNMAYVNSNTNFVSVKGDNAVVQVAFNIPISGPNGIGGVTVDGSVSDYEVKTDKKGNISISMNVMGTGISARVFISLPKGTNHATVEINPNFNSNRMTLEGVILPIEKSNVFKGRSL